MHTHMKTFETFVILTLILVRSRVIPSLPWRTFSPCHLPPTSGSSTTGCGMRRIMSCPPQRMGPSSWPPTWWSPPTRPGATVRRWASRPKFSYLRCKMNIWQDGKHLDQDWRYRYCIYYKESQFWILNSGESFSVNPHILTRAMNDSRQRHNTYLHNLFCCQDPVSVPESLCEVEDWNTNTSSSCNNDNYDSNKSECPAL